MCRCKHPKLDSQEYRSLSTSLLLLHYSLVCKISLFLFINRLKLLSPIFVICELSNLQPNSAAIQSLWFRRKTNKKYIATNQPSEQESKRQTFASSHHLPTNKVAKRFRYARIWLLFTFVKSFFPCCVVHQNFQTFNHLKDEPF